jgi:hypothetical protein
MKRTLTRKQSNQVQALGELNGQPSLLAEINEALSAGDATAFTSNSGVLIIKPTFDNGDMGLFVWVAIGFYHDSIITFLPKLEKMAIDTNCKFIKFKTRRKGFKRIAPKINFKESRPCDGFFVFTKEVNQ